MFVFVFVVVVAVLLLLWRQMRELNAARARLDAQRADLVRREQAVRAAAGRWLDERAALLSELADTRTLMYQRRIEAENARRALAEAGG